MKTLQSLRGQSLGFRFFNFSLNLTRDSIVFISGGINSQILGPKYDPDSDLLNTEFDVPYIAMYVSDDNECFLLVEKFTHYIWRHAISNHIHLNCKALKISIMYSDRIIFD